MEDLRVYMSMVEAERNNEKQMRIKLEEEYAANASSYEDEIQLRLKFEQKLNVMHTDFRNLQTINIRAMADLEMESELRIKFEDLYNGNIKRLLE